MITYDVFVSHNGRDKPIVERLCRALLEAGLRPWFDKWDLTPGSLWMREIERTLEQVSAVLVCVGAHGWSAWHEAERQAAINRTTAENSGVVIPVLLPGAPHDVELPPFLRGRQWSDLRHESAWQTEVARLAATLAGRELPGPWIDEDCERPYRGLQPFTEADAKWMFGRERDEIKLLEALRDGHRFITVVGASGSGKSSLIRAGVVPTVRTGGIDDRQRWHALVMRPGVRPCQTLALRLLELQRTLEGADRDIVGEGDALEELSERLRTSEGRLRQTVDLLLDRAGCNEHLLLVVDQFEELFTSGGDGDVEDERAREATAVLDAKGTRINPDGVGLLGNLLHATSADSGRIHVIITVRADFMGECLSVPALARRMERMHFALPPMAADQLRDAIRRPALRVGFDIEKALVDVLVNTTEDQPGRLPLLQHTLDILWGVRDRDRHRLTYAAYGEYVGSLDESVAKRAEEVFAKLVTESEKNEVAVRQVFLRLVHLGEGTGDTRRQVPRSELLSNAAKLVVDKFIEERLLVTDTYRGPTGALPEQTIEIAHDAVLGRWGRLRRWLNENREVLRLRQEVNLAATRWKEHQRPTDELWHGGRLAQACEALLDTEVDLTENERKFLETSREAESEQRRTNEQRQQRLLIGITGFSVVLIFALAIALNQYRQATNLADENAELAGERAQHALRADNETARAAAAAARSNEIALQEKLSRLRVEASLYRELEPLRAARAIAESISLGGHDEIESELRAWIKRDLVQTQPGIVSAAASPNGLMTAFGHEEITWIATPRMVAHLQYPGTTTSISFSPDGRLLATVTRGGILCIITLDDTGAPKQISAVSDYFREETNALEVVPKLLWTPDGQHIIVLHGVALVMYTASGEKVHEWNDLPREFDIIAVSPDGKDLAARVFVDAAETTSFKKGTKGLSPLTKPRKRAWQQVKLRLFSLKHFGKHRDINYGATAPFLSWRDDGSVISTLGSNITMLDQDYKNLKVAHHGTHGRITAADEDNGILAVGTQSGMVYFVDVSNEPMESFASPIDTGIGVVELVFSNNKGVVWVLGGDATAREYRISTFSRDTSDAVALDVECSPTRATDVSYGGMLIEGLKIYSEGTVRLCTDKVATHAWSPDGDYVALGLRNGKGVAIVDRHCNDVATMKLARDVTPSNMTWNASGIFMVVEDDLVWAQGIRSNKFIPLDKTISHIKQLASCPDADNLLLLGNSGEMAEMRLISLPNGSTTVQKRMHNISGPGVGGVHFSTIALHPDRNSVSAVISDENSVALYDLNEGKAIWKIAPESFSAHGAAMTWILGGSHLAVANRRRVQIIRRSDGATVDSIVLDANVISNLCTGAEGERIWPGGILRKQTKLIEVPSVASMVGSVNSFIAYQEKLEKIERKMSMSRGMKE